MRRLEADINTGSQISSIFLFYYVGSVIWSTLFKRKHKFKYLDEWGPAKEEAKHIGHDIIADHAGDGHNEPVKKKKKSAFISLLVAPSTYPDRTHPMVHTPIYERLS